MDRISEIDTLDGADLKTLLEGGSQGGTPAREASCFVVADATLPDMPIVYVNQAFEQLTGYMMQEIVGKNCRFLQGKDSNQPGLIELRAAIREKRGCRTVLRNYRKDGTRFWNDFSLTPIFNGAGEITHFVGIQNTIRQQDLLQVRVSNSTSKASNLNMPLEENKSPGRLGDILVELGIVSQATVFAAAQLKEAGDPKFIGEILVERFRVPQAAIAKGLGIQVQNARAARTQTDVFMKTAFAVRLAQKTMEAIPESDLPIFSICQPLTDAGGDTFYRVLLPDGSHLLILADVAGHSVISSYAVASFLGMLCALTPDFHGLRALLMDVNRCLQSGPFGDVPICVFAAHWDMRTGRLHLINAGVPHSIWFHHQPGDSTFVELSGNPLGVIDEPYLSEQVLALQEGDRLVFGSDGVFEAASPEGHLFQDAAAEQWSRVADKPLGDALFAFCDAARHHMQGKIQDDILLVAVEQPAVYLGPGELHMSMPSTFTAIDEACERLVEFTASVPELREQSDDWSFALLLVAREALTNAVIHGNLEDPKKLICFHCKSDVLAGRFLMTVTDEGHGYDPNGGFNKQDLQTSERGRGLSILHEFTQGVHITANELRLEFVLKGNSNDQH